jgi:anti-sigma regulatory factor (Ser/Thr protein kinase)
MSSATYGRSDEEFVHPALLYSGPADYLAGTVPFLLDGLAAGEPVTAAVPGPNLELLRAELGPAAERVRLLDMSEVGRNPGRILAEVLHTVADPHPDRHVRIIGEPVWPGRTALEYPACLLHEALVNHSFRGRRVTILCPYDAARLDPAVLADAAQTHPVLLEQGRLRSSPDFAPDRVAACLNAELPEPGPATAFPFDATLLSAARQVAAVEARRAGLGEDRTDNVVLAVGELAANSIRHGGGAGTLRMWTEGGLLVAEIRDAGTITDPLAGRRHAGVRQKNGRGLLIVQHLADLVRTTTGPDGTATRVHFRLRPR